MSKTRNDIVLSEFYNITANNKRIYDPFKGCQSQNGLVFAVLL